MKCKNIPQPCGSFLRPKVNSVHIECCGASSQQSTLSRLHFFRRSLYITTMQSGRQPLTESR